VNDSYGVYRRTVSGLRFHTGRKINLINICVRSHPK